MARICPTCERVASTAASSRKDAGNSYLLRMLKGWLWTLDGGAGCREPADSGNIPWGVKADKRKGDWQNHSPTWYLKPSDQRSATLSWWCIPPTGQPVCRALEANCSWPAPHTRPQKGRAKLSGLPMPNTPTDGVFTCQYRSLLSQQHTMAIQEMGIKCNVIV